MSLRNRARKLMRETGLSYQQALLKLRAERVRSAAPPAKAEGRPTPRPIEVVTVEAHTRAELACQQLLHTSGARVVNLVDGWRVLASAGPEGARVLFHPMTVQRGYQRLPRGERKSFEVGGGLTALIVPVKRLHLIVVYDGAASLLLLEKRVEKCVEYLEGLIEDDPLLAPPDSGDDGPGSLSAVAWESVEIWTKKKS